MEGGAKGGLALIQANHGADRGRPHSPKVSDWPAALRESVTSARNFGEFLSSTVTQESSGGAECVITFSLDQQLIPDLLFRLLARICFLGLQSVLLRHTLPRSHHDYRLGRIL